MIFFEGVELSIILFNVLMSDNVEEELGSETVYVGKIALFGLFDLYPIVVVE